MGYLKLGTCLEIGIPGLYCIRPIAVYFALKKVLEDNPAVELQDLKRFIDDIAGLWDGTEDSFVCWADKINAGLQKEFGLSIKDSPLDQ